MANKHSVTVEKNIDASPEEAWQALTDPAKIKQYLFGTDTKTDWKKGSDITYTGEWQGKSYTDKGKIIDIQPGRLLHTTYYSSMSGKEDRPENYANVIYEVRPNGNGAIVSVTQDNIENEQGVEHMKQNWSTVLDGMKKMLES